MKTGSEIMDLLEFNHKLERLEYSTIRFKEIPYLYAIYQKLNGIKENPFPENLDCAKASFDFLEAVIIRMYACQNIFKDHTLFLNQVMQSERCLIETWNQRQEVAPTIRAYAECLKGQCPENLEEKIDFFAEWLLLEKFGKIDEARKNMQVILSKEGIKVSVKQLEKLREKANQLYEFQVLLEEEYFKMKKQKKVLTKSKSMFVKK